MQRECLEYTDSELHQSPNSEVAPNNLKDALNFLRSHHQRANPTSIRMVSPKILTLHQNPLSFQVYHNRLIARDIHIGLHGSIFHNWCPAQVTEFLIDSPQATKVHNANTLQAATGSQSLFLISFNCPHDPNQMVTESPDSHKPLTPK